ncbi:MAG: hypothetical protein IAF38_04305, partial [Bacteroidia bacterium]|nr:hypothetical protein [Bacteroidia bacterium]
MDEVISFCMSNSWLLILFLLLGIFLMVWIRKFYSKRKKTLWTLRFAIFLVCILPYIFVSFINPPLFGFGNVKSVKGLFVQNNIMIASDFIEESGRFSSIKNWRLHGLNLDTGKKLFRNFPGSSFRKIRSFNNEIFIVERGRREFGYGMTTEADDYIGYN